MRCDIKAEFDRLRYRASTRRVYSILEDIAASNEDGRAVGGREWLAEATGFGEQTVRTALKRLMADGWISRCPQPRRLRASIFTINHRLSNQQVDRKTNHLISSRTRCELKATNQHANRQTNHTGVTAVRRSLGVVVSPGLDKSLTATAARATPPVDKSRETERQRRGQEYREAVAEAPDLPTVAHFIDRLYGELCGQKFPWRQNPGAAPRIASMIADSDPPRAMAAAEKLFVYGDPWTERRGWTIDELSRQFTALLARPGIQKRAAQLQEDLRTFGRPRTITEIRHQVAQDRARTLEALRLDRQKELVGA